MKTSLKLITLSLIANSVSAQDAMMLDAITIKGTKENKTYKEVTSSVTAVKGEKLQDLATNNSLDALNGVSNVQVHSDKGGGETFSIRGINNNGVTGFQKDPLASIIIDDVFQTDQAIRAGSLDFWNLDSLEIYRGGQATTQGINSLAGTIFLRHKEPSFFREGQVRLGYGSHNRQEVGVNVNEELIPGKLATRFSYNKDKTDGFIKNIATNNDKWGKKDKDNFNLSFAYLLDDENKIIVDLKHSDVNNGGSFTQFMDPKRKEVNEDFDYIRDSKNSQGSIKWYRTISESLTNELIFAYSTSKIDATSDADGLALGAADTLGKRLEWHKDHMFTIENLLHYKSDKLKNTIGLNVHSYSYENYFNFNMKFGTVFNATQADEHKKLVVSVFDTVTYDINSKLSLNAGLRLEFAKNKLSTFLGGEEINGQAINPIVLQVLGNHGSDKSKLMALPKIGLLYNVDESNSLGLAYGQAYRNGGLSVNRYQGYVSSYEPEITHNYEISHKYENKSLRISNNIFLIDWKKQQVEVSGGNPHPYDKDIKNAGESLLYGFEHQTQYRVSRDHELGLNLGLVKTKFREFPKLEGNEFPDAPQYTSLLNWNAQWTEGFSTNLISRFIGASYSDAENKRRVSPQYYIDATARYRFSSYALELYGKNLLDKNYLTYNGNKGLPGYGYYNQVSAPREIGFRVNYQW